MNILCTWYQLLNNLLTFNSTQDWPRFQVQWVKVKTYLLRIDVLMFNVSVYIVLPLLQHERHFLFDAYNIFNRYLNTCSLFNLIYLKSFSYTGFALKCQQCSNKASNFKCSSINDSGNEVECKAEENYCISITYTDGKFNN